MKTIHETKQLRSELHRLSSLPALRADPITNLVEITADMEGVQFSRSSNSAGIQSICAGDIEDEGSCIVSYSNLSAIVKSLTGSETTMELDKNRLIVTSGKSSAKIPVLTGQIYSHPEMDKEAITIALANDDLMNLLTPASDHCSLLEADAALCGVFFGSTRAEGKVLVCGCDRKRIFLGELEKKADDFRAIIPREAVNSLKSAMGDLSGAIHILISESVIRFRMGDLTASYALIGTAYPNFMSMVDFVSKQDRVNRFKVNRESLIAGISRVAPFGDDEEFKSIILQTCPNELQITGGTEGGTEFQERIGATCEAGPPIKFNSRALKSSIGALSGAAIEIEQIKLGIMIAEPGRTVSVSAMTL